MTPVTANQLRAQYGRNAAQLSTCVEAARRQRGKRYRGYLFEQWVVFFVNAVAKSQWTDRELEAERHMLSALPMASA